MAIEYVATLKEDESIMPPTQEFLDSLPWPYEVVSMKDVDKESTKAALIISRAIQLSSNFLGNPPKISKSLEMFLLETNFSPIPNIILGGQANILRDQNPHGWTGMEIHAPEIMDKGFGLRKYLPDVHLFGQLSRIDQQLPANIYVILGASGTGKSSLVDAMMANGGDPLTKTTTRKIRPSEDKLETESLSEPSFKDCMTGMVGVHRFRNRMYGFRLDKVFQAFSGRRNHYTSTNDLGAAEALKSVYPEGVKIVSILPPYDLVGVGLERRVKAIRSPSEGFASFQDEQEFLQQTDIAMKDTEQRMEKAYKERKEAERFAESADFVLTGADLFGNMEQLLGYVYDRET